MEHDRLAWWEEIPLGLALLAQSYVVGLWYFASISGAGWMYDLIVAVGAGLALDLIVVTTVMGRRQGRSSGWSWATSLGAFCCSSLIALDRYGWEWRSGLHVAFPLVVFLYSQHLAVPSKRFRATAQIPLDSLPERLVSSDQAEVVSLPTATNTSVLVAPALEALDQGQAVLSDLPLVPIVLDDHRYSCPHCGQALKSKQARGAAVSNGYCSQCKPAAKRSA